MVWPTLGSRTAKEQNRTVYQNQYTAAVCEGFEVAAAADNNARHNCDDDAVFTLYKRLYNWLGELSKRVQPSGA